MTKIRVHEYAKKVNKPSKEVIEELKKLNIEVSNHMSTLNGEAVEKLDRVFQNARKMLPKKCCKTSKIKPQEAKAQNKQGQRGKTKKAIQ